jgi:hypothetical protein
MKRGPRFLFRGHRLQVDHRLRDLGERCIGCLFFVQRFLKQGQARTQPQSIRVPQPSPQLQIRADHGQLFRRIADSVPVIADSCR